MCGIAGFWGKLGQRRHIQAMTDALVHRGPDAAGFWQHRQQPLYFGHRRLSIVDLADGQQPMHSHDGRLTLVFNGEIYNHRELRRELESLGARFKTDHSDTEVVIEAFRYWGKACLNRFNGMWAFAIWDEQRQQLFLARDRLGQKPLYWGLHKGVFAFASELNAMLLHPAFSDAAINPLALAKYFGYGFIPNPHSLYSGISKLQPGCWAEVGEGSEVRKGRFWEYGLESELAIDFESAQEELRQLLGQAVKRRLLADVPVGLFLSGGIDSSSIGSFAREQGLDRAYYVGFDEPSFDETAYVEQAAKALNLKVQGQLLSMARMPDAIQRTLQRLDEPMADPSLIPTALLCQGAAKHVKVALGGDGADELLAGYDPYLALRLASIYHRLMPKWLHHVLLKSVNALPVSHRNMSLEFKLKRTLPALIEAPSRWPVRWMAPLTTAEINQLLATSFKDEEIYSEMIALAQQQQSRTPFTYLTQYFVHGYLADNILTKVDRASMQHGLEVRSPFLDVDVVSFLSRLPAHYKLQGHTTKRLLKAAMSQRLPASVTQRKKKGFGMPIGHYFQQQGQLQDLRPIAGLSDDLRKQRLLEHQQGKANHRLFLWNWLVLQSVLDAR